MEPAGCIAAASQAVLLRPLCMPQNVHACGSTAPRQVARQPGLESGSSGCSPPQAWRSKGRLAAPYASSCCSSAKGQVAQQSVAVQVQCVHASTGTCCGAAAAADPVLQASLTRRCCVPPRRLPAAPSARLPPGRQELTGKAGRDGVPAQPSGRITQLLAGPTAAAP